MNQELRALIEVAVDQHPAAGAHEIAHYVTQNTPAEQLQAFYCELLAAACRTVINSSHKPAPKPRAHTRPRPSPKLRERRSWWAEMLASEVNVASGRKVLGDCTVTDLRYCINDREEHIGRVEAQVEHMRQIVALMGRHRVNRVRDLPPQLQWNRAS